MSTPAPHQSLRALQIWTAALWAATFFWWFVVQVLIPSETLETNDAVALLDGTGLLLLPMAATALTIVLGAQAAHRARPPRPPAPTPGYPPVPPGHPLSRGYVAPGYLPPPPPYPPPRGYVPPPPGYGVPYALPGNPPLPPPTTPPTPPTPPPPAGPPHAD